MLVREPRDNVAERLDRDGHPMRIGMEQPLAVGHQADMAGKEDDIASSEFRMVVKQCAHGLGLLVSVARRGDAVLIGDLMSAAANSGAAAVVTWLAATGSPNASSGR